ncbi:MAG: NERD domain-containing protein [Candidatus Aenigmarchaeota archaeon]|nr:NERD domain-containing protein [Candidatus Aenigmarchaeota archaeon]
MPYLEGVEYQLSKGMEIEDILEKYDWKNFETVVSKIFKENIFLTKQNFRFKTKRRYEIDVVAVKNNQVFCVDCKWWGRGRYKKSSLKNAVIEQEKRTNEFMKFLKKNYIAKSLLKIDKQTIHPLIVTLHDENMIKENQTFVVPIWKLNAFLNHLENYI